MVEGTNEAGLDRFRGRIRDREWRLGGGGGGRCIRVRVGTEAGLGDGLLVEKQQGLLRRSEVVRERSLNSSDEAFEVK
jgi:hypothetical protein